MTGTGRRWVLDPHLPNVGHELPNPLHQPSKDCWCKPVAETRDGLMLYKHKEGQPR